MQLFELHHQAVAILEHPQKLEPRGAIEGFQPRVRLWHYPSFDVYRSWLLLQRDVEWVARQVVWDRPEDARAPERGEPSIRVQDASLAGTPMIELLAGVEGAVLKVPAVDADHVVEGDGYGVHWVGATRDLRVEWWDKAPAGWESIVDWAAKVRAVLRAVFVASAPPPSSPAS